jgi:hypothetical protein
MSSYRHPYRRNVWPDREAEKREAARKAEEETRKKNEMNETNFPTLSTARPVGQQVGNEYANLAQKWAVDDAVDRRMAEHKKFQEATDRTDRERIMSRHVQRSRYERQDTVYEEEELAPQPRQPSVGVGLGIEDEGWVEVKRKTYKPKRELTVDELDDRVRRQDESDRLDSEFNGDLFDSNRHDHDRV